MVWSRSGLVDTMCTGTPVTSAMRSRYLRAFAGNFLYSTGANEVAGRHTLGHFDLPMRDCSVSLDGTPVVVDGKLQGELA